MCHPYSGITAAPIQQRDIWSIQLLARAVRETRSRAVRPPDGSRLEHPLCSQEE